MRIDECQERLRAEGIDGWLLHDFRFSNPLARRVLGLPADRFLSRRWFYFVPAKGEPRKLVHRIETGALDGLPGERTIYLRYGELEDGIRSLLSGCRRVAMEYSPRNAIPYISRVDAGTVEVVRSAGVEVVSSGDLVQWFESRWDDEQWALHLEAAKVTDSAYGKAFGHMARIVGAGGEVRETEVQKVILDHFAAHGVVTDHPPIVGVGPHSGDPHYAPVPGADGVIRQGDLVLVDLWGRRDHPRGVYSDLTRMGFLGKVVPEPYRTMFDLVARARDAAIDRVRSAFSRGETLKGWQVDDAARGVIEAAGFGSAFCHRTGHSIGRETHGNGANMDNLETREERTVLRRTCFSIEPGVYFPEFGIRSEVNVFVDGAGQVHVTGGELQREIFPLLGDWRG
ncbi:MAG: M24 family metallopeptidase [Planctomycetes bacterium]|nr:M24 family metallopeptidase [Planctomycetota bacterium]